MERAHDISLDEPCVAHQAILFMLDVLMRSNKPALKLDELYDSFGDKSFTPQMLRAVGGNEQGLRAFLLTYPSLFTINNDLISANSGTNNASGGQFVRLGGSLRKSKSNKQTANSTTPGGDETLAINGAETGSECGAEGVRCQQPASPSSRGVDGEQSASLLAQQLNISKTMKEIEQEAIAFFRKQMTKREEDWLPIVSVAGHASQSSSDVRKFVGPQNEFKNFLLKYPHIFIVRDEYCGLKGRADVSTQPFPPPSPPPRRRGIIVPAALLNQVAGVPPGANVVTSAGVTSVGNVLSRNHSFKTNHASTNRYSACANLMPNSPSSGNNGAGMYSPAGMFVNNGLLESYDRAAALTLASTSADSSPPGAMLMNSVSNASIASSSVNSNTQSSSSKSRLTPIEIRAVHYVMRILHKNGRMLLQTIPGLISRAPDQVSNIVGFTREDLIQFFKRHSAIFQLHPDGCVSVKQEAVKALILRDNNGANGTGSIDPLNGTNGAHSPLLDNSGIISGSGVVLRIFPKYGILNMDNNEQVFFDIQSCQFETFSDLTTILHISDRLFFNAIIGPRDGSTKWRSIKTWIKMRSQRQNSSTNINGMANNNNTNNTILDSVSYHSDAEKSDDSSSNNSTSQHQQYRSAFRKQQLTGYQNNNKTNSNSQMNRVNRNFVNSGGGYADEHYMVDTTRHFALAENNTFNSNQSGANGNNNNNGSVEYSENETAAVNQTNRYMMNGELNQYFIDSQKRSPPLRNDVSKSSTVLLSSANEENGENNVEKPSGSESNSPATLAGSINNTNTSSTESTTTTTPYLNGKTTTTTNNVESATKMLKASSDGVSQREIVNERAISIGCQTLSTGPINPIALFSES